VGSLPHGSDATLRSVFTSCRDILLIWNKEIEMNKDQVKGAAKDIAGKVQEEVGKLVGSKEQQAKGLGRQISGKAEKAYGDVKEVIKDANTHS
jgi:uncharacterized protein YjbJ (UPF0337 family)